MRLVRALGIAVSSLMLAACAGVGGKHAMLPSDDIDTNKVQTVNRWALDHGAQVIWINYPLRDRHAASSDGG